MRITKSLRRWAQKNLNLKSDATDAEVRAAVVKAHKAKKISTKQLEELTAVKSTPKPVATSNGRMDRLEKTVSKMGGILEKYTSNQGANKKTAGKKVEKKKAKKKPNPVDVAVKSALSKMGLNTDTPKGTGPVSLLHRAAPYLRPIESVRVKSATEQYDKTRTKAICPERTGVSGAGGRHPHAGKQAKFENRPLENPSQLDNAICGAYLKWSLETQNDPRDIPRGLKMTDHDHDLIQYALHEMPWTGVVGGEGTDMGASKVNGRKLTKVEIKALLDDSSSGGIEATPIVFDDAVVLTPVLYGELFPLVNIVNITRGRRIEGFSMGNPTFTSGTTEGAAINPFNTSAFISAFDNSIYNAVAAMEIGMDFEEDSPADIGGIVIQQYGLKAMEWLDRVVVMGDGVTEPEGIFVTVGTTAVNSDNGTSGPPTVSDYEGLMFAVTKAFRKEPGAQNAYVANEQTYRKARAIPVGPTDERRVFGMTHGDYMLLDQPYKVQIDIPNNYIGYGNFRRYRMYRRLGLNTRIETQGNYLALRNIKLIVLRMRFGGRIELGGAMGVMTDASAS